MYKKILQYTKSVVLLLIMVKLANMVVIYYIN